MGEQPQVYGDVDDGWGGVVDAFVRNFSDAGDVGAAVTIYLDGRPVVDVWGGMADDAAGRPWTHDTVGNVFSCTKGWMATLLNQLIQERLIDPADPVCRYWPEFAAGGKDTITVAQVLSHQAGVVAITGDFTLEQALSWTPVTDALAAQTTDWPPGAHHGYHLRSFGWLTGELVRRVTGHQPGEAWRRRVAQPLGLSAWIGTPVQEQGRCARLIPPAPVHSPGDPPAADSLIARVRSGPSDLFHYDEMWNRPQLRSAVIPSSGGIADARSLARLYAACVGVVDGVRLLDSDTAAAASVTVAEGPDFVLGLTTAFGRGYLVGPSLPPTAGPHAFGHGGAGGSLGFADPDPRLGFGYVLNRMRLDPDDSRARDLTAAAYRALG